MSVARVAYRISKPLWASVSARVAPALCAPSRNITTNKDFVHFGNVGGRMRIESDQSDLISDLDLFLGKWEEQGKGGKSYVSYSREDDMWNLKIVNVFSFLANSSYKFKLGLVFYLEEKDELFTRALIYQENERMRWQLQSEYGVANITHILTQVKDDKLIWDIVSPDHTKSTKIFERA